MIICKCFFSFANHLNRDLDDDEAYQINTFFQHVLEFIYTLIPYDYVEILETLTRLFTSIRCTFYMKYGKDESSEVGTCLLAMWLILMY